MTSYLGPHINAPRDQIPWLARAKPRVAKVLLDSLDPSWLRAAHDTSPFTFWVGRFVDYRSADDLVARAAPYRGLIDALEGRNEVAVKTHAEMAAFAVEEAQRADVLHRAGWKAVVGNFATGNPELYLWPSFRDALTAGDYLGLHEYSPSLPRRVGDDLWHQLRYWQVYNAMPDLRLPLIITECGVDDGCGGGWKAQPGANAQMYLDYLRWYDAALAADARRVPIVGATIFCYGRFHDDPWDSFDISGEVANMLADYIAANPPQYWEEKQMATITDRFIEAAQKALGDKFQDIRQTLPRHPTLQPILRDPLNISQVIMHWSATSTGTNTSTIANYHIAGDPARNLAPAPGIRYHIVIYSWGLVRLCWNLDVRCGHAGDDAVNARSIGVCFVTDTRPTAAALASATTLVRVLREVLGRVLEVKGHRDVSAGTECPGPTWREWMPELAAAGGAQMPSADARIRELESQLAAMTAERDVLAARIAAAKAALG